MLLDRSIGGQGVEVVAAAADSPRARGVIGKQMTSAVLVVVLGGLFELRITHLEDNALWAEIALVAEKLGGDVGAMFFGAALRWSRSRPSPDGSRARVCAPERAICMVRVAAFARRSPLTYRQL